MPDNFCYIKKEACRSTYFIRLDFNKPFILDVDWSIKGVGAILSQKFGKHEQVIAYARKDLF
jgi:hypothetical protein